MRRLERLCVAPLRPLSYSGFKTYAECPLRWKFLYIDELPQAPRSYFSFGRSVHSALEALVAPMVPAAGARGETSRQRQRTLRDFDRPRGALPAPIGLDELLRAYETTWVKEGYSRPDEERRYFELGRDLLTRYYRQFVANPPRPLAVEEDLTAEVEGLPVHGILDRIDELPSGGLEILDYKTSKELSLRDTEESDQLTLYQLLVEKNYSAPVEALTLYHLRSLTALTSPARNESAVADLTVRLGEVADGIRAEDHEPKPGPYCSRCEFRHLCPEFREIPPGERERIATLVGRYSQLKKDADALEGELRTAAEELHREAERLGVHRFAVPGTTLHRRKEVRWSFPSEQVLPLLESAGLARSTSRLDEEAIARLLHDPRVRPEIKGKLADRGKRRVDWSLELEEREPSDR